MLYIYPPDNMYENVKKYFNKSRPHKLCSAQPTSSPTEFNQLYFRLYPVNISEIQCHQCVLISHFHHVCPSAVFPREFTSPHAIYGFIKVSFGYPSSSLNLSTVMKFMTLSSGISKIFINLTGQNKRFCYYDFCCSRTRVKRIFESSIHKC